MNQVKPIFIFGTGRSGTTLLRALLNAHPDLHISKESSVYFELREKALVKDPAKELKRFFSSAPFLWLGLSSVQVTDALPRRPTRREVFQTLMQLDAKRYGKPYWGDKTPGHWMHLKALKADFPEGVLIHIYRDPRDVVKSLQKMPWGSPSFIANALYYQRTLTTLFNDPALIQIRFEALLEDPEGHLKHILAKAGLEWSPQLLDHARFAPNDVNQIPWLASAYQPLKPKLMTAHQEDLRDAWIEFFCKQAFQKNYLGRKNKPNWQALWADLPAMAWTLYQMAKIFCWPLQRGEPELRAWLSHNPRAFQNWPGWDIERVIRAQLAQSNSNEALAGPPRTD